MSEQRRESVLLDRATALALLLPAAVLAWPGPGSLLAGDPNPGVTGTGVLALAALPAAALSMLHRGRVEARGLALLLAHLGLGLIVSRFGGLSDTFGARSALLLSTSCLVLFQAGAGLGLDGRKWLVRGTVLVSLILSLGAELHPGGAGPLQNTGALAAAALPGAVLGAFFLATERGPWQWTGAAALGLHAAQDGRAPSWGGLLALGLGIAALALFGKARFGDRSMRWKRMAVPLALATVAALCGMALAPSGDARLESAEVAAEAAGAQAPLAPTSTGGIEVRLRVWGRLSALLADFPALGVGPGQFAAEFPPYRDPAEIELSSFGRRLEQEKEVEHAHNDLLNPVAESGLLGGSLFALFWVLLLRTAVLQIRRDPGTRAALGAAMIGLLAMGLIRAPLHVHPIAAALGFGIAGALLGRRDRGGEVGRARQLLPVGLFVLLAIDAGSALDLVRHGQALTASHRALAEFAAVDDGTTPTPDSLRAARLFDAHEEAIRAVEFAPDSPRALAHLARLEGSMGTAGEEVRALWLLHLSVRPHSIEGLVQLGIVEERLGNPEAAREAWTRALELDPGHPRVLRNLAQLELDSSEVDRLPDDARAYLRRLEAAGLLDRDWLRDRCARELLAARFERAEELLAMLDADWGSLGPTQAHGIAEQLEESAASDPNAHPSHARLRVGLRVLAQARWARRDFASQENWDQAVISYRHALRLARDAGHPGPPVLRFEMAAAQLLAGDPDGARGTLEGLEADAVSLRQVPEWTSRALIDGGLWPGLGNGLEPAGDSGE